MTHDKDVPAEDDLGARRLIARYAQLMDDRDVEAAAELFEADGRVLFNGTEHRGQAAVRDWIAGVMGGLPASQHQMTNVVVSYGSKQDTLHAVSDLSLLIKGEQGWGIVATGRYHDTFAGHGRHQRFRQRVIKLG